MVDFSKLKLVADYGLLVGESIEDKFMVNRCKVLQDICIDQLSYSNKVLHKNRVKKLRELISELAPVVDMMRNDILNERMNELAKLPRTEQAELQTYYQNNPVRINLPKF